MKPLPAAGGIIASVVETIRDATVSDAHGIGSVHVSSWQLAYRNLLPDELLDGLCVAARQRSWCDILSNAEPRSAVLVVCREEEILGFASLGARREDGLGPEAGELYAIYIHSGYWRRGIGGRLHSAALERLGALGFCHITLWVLVGNERAIRFYHRAGWTEYGCHRTEMRPGGVELNEVRLDLSLHKAKPDAVMRQAR